MKYDDYSDEQLNAFLDAQLDEAERARIMQSLASNKPLAEKLCRLRQVKDMVTLAYGHPPKPYVGPRRLEHKPPARRIAAAALLFLAMGLGLGWTLHGMQGGFRNDLNPAHMASVTQVQNHGVQNDRVLLHIDSMDDQRVDTTFAVLENLLNADRADGSQLKLEVVANADGLKLLRAGSPYAERIRTLSRKYKNISFLACGVAMENAKLKEGADIKLLPEAHRVDAALSQIVRRLEEGWTYVKS